MSTALQLTALTASGADWVETAQAMEITGCSDEWLRQQRQNGRVISRESDSRTANGRPVRLYLAASLPARHALVLQPPSTQAALPLFSSPAPAPELRVVLPDPAAQAQAEERLDILRPILNYAADPARYKLFRLEDGTPVTSQTRLILYVAAVNRKSERTLKLWLARFRQGGFAALADKPPDRASCRWHAQDSEHGELAELAAYAYLHEQLSKKMAWEIVKTRAETLHIEAPSYETVRAMLENLSPAVRTLALEGRRKYDEIFAPYISRGYTDFEANEIWVSDHAWHDVLVQNDLFDQKTREHMRLRFTGLLDMRSRKLTGYAWSQEGSSRSICTCTRHAIETYGPARLLYCDNGKDFQRVGKGARVSAWNVEEIPPEVMGIYARLGIGVDYCQPFHPQAKLIERFNNTLHQRFDRRFTTYCGPTPEQRPERCIRALERHKKLLAQGRADESDLPLASEFIRACVAWFESEYHTMTKDVKGMEGLTPNEAFEQFRWHAQQPPPDRATLACLLAERTTRTIHEGAIKLFNRRYVGVDEASKRALHDRSGTDKECVVAYDYPDADWLAAIDEDGYIFAQLEPEVFLRHAKDAETQEAIGQSMRERQHRYHETRDQLNDLSRRVLSTGYISQNDQMLQIGRLPLDISQLVVHRPQLTKADIINDTPARPATPAEAARIALASLQQKRNVNA
jgi:hypothetical protein